MARCVSLRRVRLAYRGGLVLHTAISGAVAELDELRLVVEEHGEIAALGATRVNIAYLSGIDPKALIATCVTTAPALDWEGDWAAFIGRLDAAFPDLPASVRMLFEMAATDALARAAGQPLSVFLGGSAEAGTPTNQTLFHSTDADLLERATAYVERGFCNLKLRIGIGDFAADLRRLRLLREHFGPALRLSADANGAWDAVAAAERLKAVAGLGLDYVEQPLPAADWTDVARVAAESPVPVMLDESLGDEAAIARLAATRAAPLGHLKLAKLGGIDRLLRAGRRLAGAGIGAMVGQMNEGSVSTLAAAHAAIALEAPHRELYGADGIAGDPAGPLRYANGLLHLPPGPGIGLLRPVPEGTLLWERAT